MVSLFRCTGDQSVHTLAVLRFEGCKQQIELATYPQLCLICRIAMPTAPAAFFALQSALCRSKRVSAECVRHAERHVCSKLRFLAHHKPLDGSASLIARRLRTEVRFASRSEEFKYELGAAFSPICL